MAIESQPLINLQNKQIQYEAQISAFGQLRSSMASFQQAMENLGTISTLDLYKTTSADDSVITASAESGADVGNYGIEVVRTADCRRPPRKKSPIEATGQLKRSKSDCSTMARLNSAATG